MGRRTLRRRHQEPGASGRNRGMVAVLGAGLLIVLAFAAPAAAQDFTVTNTSDLGAGSLLDAADQANDTPGADRILFAPNVTGTIAPPAFIRISDSAEILGPGADLLTIHPTPERPGFVVAPATQTDPALTVTISGLKVAGGSLSVQAVPAPQGAGVLSISTDLTLSKMVFSGNSVSKVINPAFVGGAVSSGVRYNDRGSLTVIDSTFSGNSAAAGGAIATNDNSVTIKGSTFDRNNAAAGGAVAAQLTGSATMTIENSTFTGNGATESPRPVGGAIAVLPGSDGLPAFEPGVKFRIESSTISGNNASFGGGVATSLIPTTIHNSIIAGNTAATGPDLLNDVDLTYDPEPGTFPQTPIDLSFSQLGSDQGSVILDSVPRSNILGQPAGLGPLADNGGPTRTMALTPASPALNKGSTALILDQRGEPRPVEYPGVPNSGATSGYITGADMGAFELQMPAVKPPVNRFSFGKLKLNRKKGTATLAVRLPGAGKLVLVGTRAVKKRKKSIKAKGTLKLKIRAKGKSLKKLRKRHKIKVKVKVRFRPTGGKAATRSRTVKLVRK